jgi:hypothetical protein
MSLAWRLFLCAVAIVALNPPGTSVSAVNSPSAGDPALNADSRFTSAQAQPQQGDGQDQGVYFPPLAGPTSEITGSVFPDQIAGSPARPQEAGTTSAAGPVAFYVGTVRSDGSQQYYQGKTDEHGRFHLRAPELAGVVALMLFKHFDSHGKPDQGATCRLTNTSAELPGTQAVINARANGPAILGVNTAYERGGASQGVMTLRVRSIDPLRSAIIVNGSTRAVDTLATSDLSVVGKLHDDVPLGHALVGVRSNGELSNQQQTDVVAQRFDPLGPMRSGEVKTVTLHIDGLGNDRATVQFTVGGAAVLANGAAVTTVPVHDGLASCEIRAVNPGQLNISTVLFVDLPLIAYYLAEQTPHPRTTSRPPGETYTPAPKTSPSPSETPYKYELGSFKPSLDLKYHYSTSAPTTRPTHPPSTPTPSPTPTPPIVRPTPTPFHLCRTWVTDGWFAPTQGVWQDDVTFFEKPAPYIREGDVVYAANVDMAAGRAMVLVGVDHYKKNGEWHYPKSRPVITISGLTTCTTLVKVKLKFTITAAGGVAPNTYTTRVLALIPLLDPPLPNNATQPWAVSVGAELGLPPGQPFVFQGPGKYDAVAEVVLEDDTPTGLSMSLHGNVVKTVFPTVHFVKALLSPRGSYKGTEKEDLTSILPSDKYLAKVWPPWAIDYLPLAPGSTVGIAEGTRDYSSLGIPDYFWTSSKDETIIAKASDILNAVAKVGQSGRVVMLIPESDFKQVHNAAGFAFSQKVVGEYAPPGSRLTTTHELIHTLPFLWSSSAMQDECDKKYHNADVPWAHGLRLYHDGVLGQRANMDNHVPIMGSGNGEDWIAQCTFWHLLAVLQKPPDPDLVLVRGFLFRHAGRVDGRLKAAYDVRGSQDLVPGPATGFAIAVRDAGGALLSSYPFKPQWILPETSWDRNLVDFDFRVPATAQAAEIDLLGPGGVLDRIHRSASRPSIAITQPADGSVVHPVRDVVPIRWTASGAPGRTLLFTVLYSKDDGHTYFYQSFEQRGTAYDLRLDQALGSHYVKLVVTDGWSSAESTVHFRASR